MREYECGPLLPGGADTDIAMLIIVISSRLVFFHAYSFDNRVNEFVGRRQIYDTPLKGP